MKKVKKPKLNEWHLKCLMNQNGPGLPIPTLVKFTKSNPFKAIERLASMNPYFEFYELTSSEFRLLKLIYKKA